VPGEKLGLCRDHVSEFGFQNSGDAGVKLFAAAPE
jgi:hypothetical protein